MKKSITITKTTLEDASAVHALIPEFDADYIDKNIERLNIRHKNPYNLVATIDGVPVGYMIGYDRDDAPKTMHIWLNGTVSEHRGKGIFTKLLAALLEEAHKRGHERVTVKSDKKRYAAMVRVLESSGFKCIATDGDSVRYEKRLV